MSFSKDGEVNMQQKIANSVPAPFCQSFFLVDVTRSSPESSLELSSSDEDGRAENAQKRVREWG